MFYHKFMLIQYIPFASPCYLHPTYSESEEPSCLVRAACFCYSSSEVIKRDIFTLKTNALSF